MKINLPLAFMGMFFLMLAGAFAFDKHQETQELLALQETELMKKKTQLSSMAHQTQTKTSALKEKDVVIATEQERSASFEQQAKENQQQADRLKKEVEQHKKDLQAANQKLKQASVKKQSHTKAASVKKTKSKSRPPGIRVQATAYTAFCDTGCTGITATGVNVKNTTTYNGYRVIAVDPRVIPLYSIVEVTQQNGERFQAIALDTGGAIKGNKVDLLVGSHSQAVQFGRQAMTVTILNR